MRVVIIFVLPIRAINSSLFVIVSPSDANGTGTKSNAATDPGETVIDPGITAGVTAPKIEDIGDGLTDWGATPITTEGTGI